MEEGRQKTFQPNAYERLQVYQRSYALALRIHRGTQRVADEDLVRQIRRASRSIPANIAEGVNRSNSAAETRRFLSIASRSGDEVRVWLSFCRDLELVPSAAVAEWEQELAEIGAMLFRLWQKWERGETVPADGR
jgi:four helix bundle protein